MALVVEDGTGLSTAESYISVADADTRHSDLGNTAWAALSTGAKEAALRAATDYMEGSYRQAWKGTRRTRDQALSWPRYGVIVDGWCIDSTIVPAEVAGACADLALRASTATLAPDIERAVIREKIGALETEYAPNQPLTTRYRAVDMALAPFLRSTAMTCRLVRA